MRSTSLNRWCGVQGLSTIGSSLPNRIVWICWRISAIPNLIFEWLNINGLGMGAFRRVPQEEIEQLMYWLKSGNADLVVLDGRIIANNIKIMT